MLARDLWPGTIVSVSVSPTQDPCNQPRVRDTEASRAVFVVVCETNAISLAIDSWALLSTVSRSQILLRELRSCFAAYFLSPSPTHQVSLLVGF